MQTGRKILNLRCDRKVSQQDLARACDITPSALSKIEAGINSPRAGIIWKIARNLGVTVEYLLDEGMPYPYPSHRYRQDFIGRNQDPDSNVRMEVSRVEKAFLNALRDSPDVAREIAYAIPEVSHERLHLIHCLVNQSTVANPTRKFLKSFEALLTTGDVPPPSPVDRAGATRRRRAGRKDRAGKNRVGKARTGKNEDGKKRSTGRKRTAGKRAGTKTGSPRHAAGRGGSKGGQRSRGAAG